MAPKLSKSWLYGIAAAAVSLSAIAAGGLTGPLTAGLPKTVEIRDMTWVEARAAIAAGYKTVLVPTGGIEQNGPHMILGKHDYIVNFAAQRIAKEAGLTLVAPVVSYVPEGSFAPLTGHLRFPGTIGVSDQAFAGILDGIARSLRAHGFKLICFLGDHGGSQPIQREVAAALTEEWQREGVRAVNIDAYYDDAQQIARLRGEGESLSAIGQHATIIDTSELMAIHPEGVDLSRVSRSGLFTEETGSSGEPSRASASRGRDLIEMRIRAAIAQIKSLRGASG
jgi:creatinine amidohydrolase/Fe(II)-dependent formamide hydrolase-like protein